MVGIGKLWNWEILKFLLIIELLKYIDFQVSGSGKVIFAWNKFLNFPIPKISQSLDWPLSKYQLDVILFSFKILLNTSSLLSFFIWE